MSEQQQQSPTKVYNSRDHLVTIPTKNGPKEYYPAAWRLYELNIRYEEANFSSEILFMDLERNFVIVKCKLYLGPDYEVSHRKTEAMKQGQLSQLDKLETAAKARCARDRGISTELALDMEDGEVTDLPATQTPGTSSSAAPVQSVQAEPSSTVPGQGNSTAKTLDPAVAKERLDSFYLLAKKLGVCKTDQEFVTYVCKLLSLKSFDIKAFTGQHLTALARDLKSREQRAA